MSLSPRARSRFLLGGCRALCLHLAAVKAHVADLAAAVRRESSGRISGSLSCVVVCHSVTLKAGGKQRPLAIAALEGKIVKRATVAVLNAIYEEERNSHLRVVVVGTVL